MKWSLYIGKPAGIKVFIHWTFILLVIWLSWMHLQQGHGLFEIILGLIFLAALFGCITLHEFGHALAARRYGIGTRDINLLPIGGVARLERMPEDPKEELVVAIAGPAVNVVIAIGLYLIMLVLGQSNTELSHHVAGGNFLADLLLINIILVLFNLIPAFPMDGGRVLRALLAFKMKRSKATRVAASVGQLLAIGFVLFGLFYNPWLLFIGIFVFIGAGAESQQVTMQESLREVKAKDLITTGYPALPQTASVSKAATAFMESREPELVITDDEERFVGLLSYERIIEEMQKGHFNNPVVNLVKEEVQTLTPDALIYELLPQIQQSGQRIFPVLDDDRLAGVISHTDLIRLLEQNQAVSASGHRH
ncbi:Zn-dependent protease (includes SpoIVFB) [Fodinibius roseus]|uniref:Zinc metalloprotease n=1 Tax=Fodinibius roseus TaxID=1194090 RepID=A0A1M5B8U8_9BACT|nr:site-2 protease family protein [Fodinibius roseus]SHF38602.1 Zn-dependent protease (includes SpoIVFB) [Fodinibius roseus]